jgi:RimJ/RimL family protein N-acetyltransferase
MDLQFPDELATTRLILTRRRVSDAAELKAVIDNNLDHLRPWMPWAMNEPSPLEAIEARMRQFERDFDNGSQWLYGIRLKTDRAEIGSIGVHPRIGEGGLEIGYWLAADACGNGYITEAVEALTRLCLDQPSIDRVEIRCDPRNVRSYAVPRRLGFTHVTTIVHDAVTPDGSPRDTMVWQARRGDRQ